jgi:non-canonical (house-cleaning) NTP pyrophosphatase
MGVRDFLTGLACGGALSLSVMAIFNYRRSRMCGATAGTRRTEGAQGGISPCQVVVASKTDLKLSAVLSAFETLGIQRVTVLGVSADSGINDQPIGHEETMRGCVNRLRGALLDPAAQLASFVVSIENGIVELETPAADGSTDRRYFDLAYVCVENVGTGDRFWSHSCGLEFPASLVQQCEKLGFDKTTVGSLIAAAEGGDKQDPHSTLTRGAVTRAACLRQAVVAALGLCFA